MSLRISLLAVLAALLSAAPAAAQSTTIVISEYRTRGPAGGNDEFIELRNRSAAPVDIGGYRVNGSNASGTVSTRATIPAGVTLGAGCAYLLANSAGSVAGDQTYGTGITDDGGLAVLTGGLEIVDQVGQSAGSAYKEGTPLAPTPSNADQSYERDGDTDDNAADFTLRTPAEPESGCDDGPTWPSVTATDPADGATEVDEDTNVRVTFSEPVTAADGAFALACGGTAAPFTVSGDGTDLHARPDLVAAARRGVHGHGPRGRDQRRRTAPIPPPTSARASTPTRASRACASTTSRAPPTSRPTAAWSSRRCRASSPPAAPTATSSRTRAPTATAGPPRASSCSPAARRIPRSRPARPSRSPAA